MNTHGRQRNWYASRRASTRMPWRGDAQSPQREPGAWSATALPVGRSAACVTRDLWTLCGVVARVSVEETGGPAHRLSPRLSARMGLVVRILVGLSPSRKGWFCCIASDGDGCSSSIITLGDGATCAHTSRELARERVGRAKCAERRHAAGRHRVPVVVHEGAEQLLPLLDALPGLLQLRGDLG